MLGCFNSQKTKNEALVKKLKDLEKEQEEITLKQHEIEKQNDKFNMRKHEKQREIDEFQKKTFQKFYKKLGITEIAEFETLLSSRNKRIQDMKQMKQNLADLNLLKSQEESRSKAEEIPNWKSKLNKIQQRLQKLQVSLDQLNDKITETSSKIKKLETTLEKEQSILTTIDDKRKELFNAERLNRKRIARVSRRRETLTDERQEILSSAKVDEISLPEAFGSSLSSSQSSVEDSQKTFDFSRLGELETSKDVERLQEKLAILDQTLDETRLHVNERLFVGHDPQGLNTMKGEVGEIEERVADLKIDEKDLMKDFVEVQKKRLKAFVAFFDKASEAIDDICKVFRKK